MAVKYERRQDIAKHNSFLFHCRKRQKVFLCTLIKQSHNRMREKGKTDKFVVISHRDDKQVKICKRNVLRKNGLRKLHFHGLVDSHPSRLILSDHMLKNGFTLIIISIWGREKSKRKGNLVYAQQ